MQIKSTKPTRAGHYDVLLTSPYLTERYDVLLTSLYLTERYGLLCTITERYDVLYLHQYRCAPWRSHVAYCGTL